MINPLPLFLIALAVAYPSRAVAENDFQQWLTVSARVDVGEAVALQGESIARFGDDTDGLYELENSLILGYQLGGQVTAWAGYVHNPTYDGGEFVIMEQRAREQITVDGFAQLGPASLSARLRFEQRWRNGVEGTGWRMRPYLRVAIPLGDERLPVLNFTAEPFFNLNTTEFQPNSGLDRLRSGVSLSIPVANSVRLEAGYINQHSFVRSGQDSGDHAVTASLALSL